MGGGDLTVRNTFCHRNMLLVINCANKQILSENVMNTNTRLQLNDLYVDTCIKQRGVIILSILARILDTI